MKAELLLLLNIITLFIAIDLFIVVRRKNKEVANANEDAFNRLNKQGEQHREVLKQYYNTIDSLTQHKLNNYVKGKITHVYKNRKFEYNQVYLDGVEYLITDKELEDFKNRGDKYTDN